MAQTPAWMFAPSGLFQGQGEVQRTARLVGRRSRALQVMPHQYGGVSHEVGDMSLSQAGTDPQWLQAGLRDPTQPLAFWRKSAT